jgi:REP element-mobilizing transposase RayT
MTYYERNLPHWHPAESPIFLTWRLHGSLPSSVVSKWIAANRMAIGEQFRVVDLHLDRSQNGPLWLKDPRVAACIVAALKRGENPLLQYGLHAFVVMANHVHILFTPKVPVARITRGMKGVAARDANKILGRIGKRFWQEESFDHWVRNAREFDRIRNYIEWNPVTAGLAKKSEEWAWSSASVI